MMNSLSEKGFWNLKSIFPSLRYDVGQRVGKLRALLADCIHWPSEHTCKALLPPERSPAKDSGTFGTPSSLANLCLNSQGLPGKIRDVRTHSSENVLSSSTFSY